MDTFQIIVGLSMVIACIILVAYLSYQQGAKGAGKALDSIAGDTPVLDRVEGTITGVFKPEQIDFFRQVIFPVFALGLSITPQGDLHEDIAKAQKLVDILTDRRPNAPADPAPVA